MRLRLAFVLVALGVSASAPPPARSQEGPVFDLQALLECRADASTYFSFRKWISQGGPPVARAGFAWRKTNTFQAEYGLLHPANVAGLQARALGLTNDGVVAVVAGITPNQLSKRLGTDPLFDSASMFVANKLVRANDAAKAHAGQVQVAPTDMDALLGVTPTQPAYDAEEVVQVVTNMGQPGKTMVGCNYISSVESPNLPFPRR